MNINDIAAEIDDDSDVDYDIPLDWPPPIYQHSDLTSPMNEAPSPRTQQAFGGGSKHSSGGGSFDVRRHQQPGPAARLKARWFPSERSGSGSSVSFRQPSDYPPLHHIHQPKSSSGLSRRKMHPGGNSSYSSSSMGFSNSVGGGGGTSRHKATPSTSSRYRDHRSGGMRGSSSDYHHHNQGGGSRSSSSSSNGGGSRNKQHHYSSGFSSQRSSKVSGETSNSSGNSAMRSRPPASAGQEDRRAMHNVQEQNRRLAIKRLLKRMQCLYPEHVKVEVLGETYTSGQDLTNPQTMRCLERYVRDIADQFDELEMLKEESKRLKRLYGGGDIDTD